MHSIGQAVDFQDECVGEEKKGKVRSRKGKGGEKGGEMDLTSKNSFNETRSINTKYQAKRKERKDQKTRSGQLQRISLQPKKVKYWRLPSGSATGVLALNTQRGQVPNTTETMRWQCRSEVSMRPSCAPPQSQLRCFIC